MDTIEFNGRDYPKFQSEGNAARWIMPYAKHFCKGEGVDIGAHTKAWAFPGASVIDPVFDGQHAMSFGYDNLDYIFSSHCLEHVKENWYNVLDYWLTKIKEGGIIFLYLPHKSQEYWLPKNNRKHIHSFDGSEIKEYLESLGHQVFLSSVDLNNAFVLVCEKKWDDPKLSGKSEVVIKGEDLAITLNRAKAISHANSGDTCIDTPAKSSFVNSATGVNPLHDKTAIEAELISPDCIWYKGKAYTL